MRQAETTGRASGVEPITVQRFDRIRDSRPPGDSAGNSRLLTIIAQDPVVTGEDGRVLTAEVSVPVDRLEPGPRSHRFHVVDFDAASGQMIDPRPDPRDRSADPRDRDWTCVDAYEAIRDDGDQVLLTDPSFRAQNVYAVAARTLATFEFALGRRIEWSFGSHELYIVPRAFADANAHYSRADRGLYFGYLPLEGGSALQTCLSHDIVCHETTHAILDGLRPRFLEPTLPDQPAFHEALGDIVAILSVFSINAVIETALGRQDPEGRISIDGLERSALGKSIIYGIGEHFGEVTSGIRGSALRRSSELEAGSAWREDPAFDEPHRRGEILVAAVIDAHVGMWMKRLKALEHAGGVNRQRAAEEGAKAASHLLTMVIRSLDYAPAIEVEFEDVLDAIVVADEIVAPDDHLDYRGSVLESFERYGIYRPEGRIVDLSELGTPLRYEQINASALRSSKDEAYRFIWQNREVLELQSDWHLQVESLRPAIRVGPDGLVVQEVVCDYVQMVEMTTAQARELAAELEKEGGNEMVVRPGGRVPNMLQVPGEEALAASVPLQLWGGGTVVFDQFGRAKLHQRKDLNDWARQSERLSYLVSKGLYDTDRRLGFSSGSGTGTAFADLHAADSVAGEAW